MQSICVFGGAIDEFEKVLSLQDDYIPAIKGTINNPCASVVFFTTLFHFIGRLTDSFFYHIYLYNCVKFLRADVIDKMEKQFMATSGKVF